MAAFETFGPRTPSLIASSPTRGGFRSALVSPATYTATRLANEPLVPLRCGSVLNDGDAHGIRAEELAPHVRASQGHHCVDIASSRRSSCPTLLHVLHEQPYSSPPAPAVARTEPRYLVTLSGRSPRGPDMSTAALVALCGQAAAAEGPAIVLVLPDYVAVQSYFAVFDEQQLQDARQPQSWPNSTWLRRLTPSQLVAIVRREDDAAERCEAALRSCAAAGLSDYAAELLYFMAHAGVRVSAVHHSHLVSALCNAGRLGDAHAVVAALPSSPAGPLSPPVAALLSGSAAGGALSSILSITRRLTGEPENSSPGNFPTSSLGAALAAAAAVSPLPWDVSHTHCVSAAIMAAGVAGDVDTATAIWLSCIGGPLTTPTAPTPPDHAAPLPARC